MEELLVGMIEDYQGLNPSYIEELNDPPSPLVFASFVQRNRPVVFRGLGTQLQIPALGKWTAAYLETMMGDTELKIAATPEG